MKIDKIGLRISEDKKKTAEDRAEAEGKTLSQLVIEALDIYLSIPPRFLKKIEMDADELGQPVGITIARLFAAYTAMTSAMVNEGIKTPIFDYAFKKRDGKLIDLNEMGKEVFLEVQKKIRDLKDLAEKATAKAKGSRKRMAVDEATKAIMTYAL